MSVQVVTHWLRDAERVRFPLRRVSGGRAVVCLGRLPRGGYQIAVDTGCPGHGGWSACLRDDCVLANRHNALLAGLCTIRDYWRARDVPAMVADVQDCIDALY